MWGNMMMDCTIKKYDISKETEWDEFVLKQSVNGTFLQTRFFLNYHPKGRFKDCSLLVYDNNNLVAVCPACEIEESGNRIFFSHKGSTYGGLIISSKY